MAQNYRDGKGRQVETVTQDLSDRKLFGLTYARESFQDRKMDSFQGEARKPENAPIKERNTDYPGTEKKAYSEIQDPSSGDIGQTGVGKLHSVRSSGFGVEYRFAERRCDSDKVEVQAGSKALKQDPGVAEPGVDNLEQHSDSMQPDSKLDSMDMGEGYLTKQVQEEPSAKQKSEVTNATVTGPLHNKEVSGEQHPHVDETRMSPGFVEKIKDMLTGNKPHTEATIDNIGDRENAGNKPHTEATIDNIGDRENAGQPQPAAATHNAGAEACHEDERPTS